MTIYIIQLLVITFFGFLFSLNGLTRKKAICFLAISGIILIFISAFRSPLVGTDTNSYVYYFDLSKNLNISQILKNDYGIEKGYLIYNWLVSRISDQRWVLFMINAIIINVPILYYIYKNSRYIVLSVYLYITLYLYGVSLNVTRQFLAIGIFLLGFEILKRGHRITYIVLILIASTFHQSAIIFLIIGLLLYIKPNWKNMLIIGVLVSIGTVVFYSNPLLILRIASGYAEKYAGTDFLEMASVQGSIIIWVVQIILYILAILIQKNSDKKLDVGSKINIFVSSIMVLISVSISILSTRMQILSRFSYFFEIFMIILIPYIVFYFFKEKKLTQLIIFLLLFMYYIFRLNTGFGEIVPYRFML
ncbi:EpsG family protein [Aerococcus viridans]|uniref:EpsG family protein n=1 Tax=Aerococcus viridans TaxID=1377 RepID=UPI00223B9DE5|nr:EpsG family protein [Aerococcus viridans]MCT1797324.1 EpsG family protein [Aerococcus viridans]